MCWSQSPAAHCKGRVIHFETKPRWNLIPIDVARRLALADCVVVGAHFPVHIVAQIAAAMTEKRAQFTETSPQPSIWFRLPSRLTQKQSAFLKTIPPIPPQWKNAEVFVSNPKVYWVAYDANGQRHHCYTSDWKQQREHTKIMRVLSEMAKPTFQTKLQRLISNHANDPHLGAFALATMILQRCPLRPGSNSAKNFGLTTLTSAHLHKNELNFVGKSGQQNVCKVNSTISRLMRAPNKNKTLLGISDHELRTYLYDNLGVTTKDFRTMRANQTFFEMTRNLPTNLSMRDRAALLKSVSEAVSKQLNNTATIARQSYISGVLQAAFMLSPEVIGFAHSLAHMCATIEKSAPMALLRAAKLQSQLDKLKKDGKVVVIATKDAQRAVTVH